MTFDPIVMFCKVGKWVTFLILLPIGNCYKIGVFVHDKKQTISIKQFIKYKRERLFQLGYVFVNRYL